MSKPPPRSFRLSEDTNVRISLLAERLGLTQTDVIEMGVLELARQHLSERFHPPEKAANPDNEILALHYEAVAESYAADPDISQGLKDAIWRIHTATAKSLRNQNSE